MFKRLVTVGLFLLMAGVVWGKGADITFVGEPTIVWASTSTWTSLIQKSTTTAGSATADCTRDTSRIAIKLDLPEGATDQFLILMSNSSSAPAAPIANGDLYDPGDPPWIYPASGSVYFYILSLGTAENKIIYQQLRGSF